MKRVFLLILALVVLLSPFACRQGGEDSTVIRIGSFPNITHLQALVARNMSRRGEGWFERYLPGYTIEWQTYNAGPSAAEAIFGRTVDLTYIGPSPAINAYAVSAGREMRLLAGAVNGGAALLVRPGAGIRKPEDFRGRSIATPQLGNTQDVSCRAWLSAHGLSCTLEGGGDVRVSPTTSSLQLQLMKQGKLDACWTVEPWVSMMEKAAGARLLVQEPDVVTTVLAARVNWLKTHPKEAEAILRAHEELTQWIKDNPRQALKYAADELSQLTQSPVDIELTEGACKRLNLTTEINLAELERFVKEAQAAGLLDRTPPLDGMIYHPSVPKKNPGSATIPPDMRIPRTSRCMRNKTCRMLDVGSRICILGGSAARSFRNRKAGMVAPQNSPPHPCYIRRLPQNSASHCRGVSRRIRLSSIVNRQSSIVNDLVFFP